MYSIVGAIIGAIVGFIVSLFAVFVLLIIGPIVVPEFYNNGNILIILIPLMSAGALIGLLVPIVKEAIEFAKRQKAPYSDVPI